MITYLVNIVMILPLLYVIFLYLRNKSNGEKYKPTTVNILLACVLWVIQLLFQFPALMGLFTVTPELSLLYNYVQQMVILLFLNFSIDMNIAESFIENRKHFKNVTVVASYLLCTIATISSIKFLPETHVEILNGATRLQTTGSSAGDALFRIPLLFMLGMIGYVVPNLNPFKVLKYGAIGFFIARLIKLVNSIFFDYQNVILDITSQLTSLTAVLTISVGLIMIVYRKKLHINRKGTN